MSDYLILRKDNLIPSWPCFVLDGYHPAAASAMAKFAAKSRALGIPSDHYFAIARQMRDIAGSPPPMLATVPLIEKAIRSPGARVAFYMLNTGSDVSPEERTFTETGRIARSEPPPMHELPPAPDTWRTRS